jgi:hypothetical protein
MHLIPDKKHGRASTGRFKAYLNSRQWLTSITKSKLTLPPSKVEWRITNKQQTARLHCSTKAEQ